MKVKNFELKNPDLDINIKNLQRDKKILVNNEDEIKFEDIYEKDACETNLGIAFNRGKKQLKDQRKWKKIYAVRALPSEYTMIKQEKERFSGDKCYNSRDGINLDCHFNY